MRGRPAARWKRSDLEPQESKDSETTPASPWPSWSFQPERKPPKKHDLIYKFHDSDSDHLLELAENVVSEKDVDLEEDNVDWTKKKVIKSDLQPLSDEQNEILEAVKRRLNVFFTGPAGSGKTLVINHIKEYLDSEGIQYAVTAPTGIAALLLKGRTIHSWAGIGRGDKPIHIYENRLRKAKPAVQLEYNRTKVLIIDEVSMVLYIRAWFRPTCLCKVVVPRFIVQD